MSHDAQIVAQFTKMAGAFASSPRIVDRDALDLLLKEAGASCADDSLDVACGAGVVACTSRRSSAARPESTSRRR
jgi:hypothetical protein